MCIAVRNFILFYVIFCLFPLSTCGELPYQAEDFAVSEGKFFAIPLKENEANLQANQVITLTLGGDVVLGVREGWWRREDALPAYLQQYGMDWPFSGLREVFASDDLTFVNLECVLKADSSGERTDKEYRFRGMPDWAQVLVNGSIEQVNIANNHYIDYQAAGKRSTRLALEKVGVAFSGYGYTYIWEKDGVKIGFSGIRETIYKQNRSRIAEEIQHLKNEGCQVVIYSCHWGQEYSLTHNDLQLEMAQQAAEAGADLVVGTHPHVPQGLSDINGTVVFWSLGNLMFGGTIDLQSFDGLLSSVSLYFSDEKYLGCEVRLLPVLTSGRAQEGINDYCPQLADEENKERIFSVIQEDSDILLEESLWFPARDKQEKAGED